MTRHSHLHLKNVVWSTEGTEVQVVLENFRNAEVAKPCCMVVGFELISS